MNRAVWLVYAQNLLVFTALNAGRVMLSLYALDIGATASDVGVVISMLYVFPLLLSWPTGIAADRFGARWLFVAGSAISSAAMLAPFAWPALPAMWIGAAGLGLATTFANVLGQNLVGALSAPAERTRNFSNYTLAGALSGFIGPLVAGFSIDHAGFANTCLLVSGLSATATVIVLAWGGVLPRGSQAKNKGGNMLATLGRPALRRILVVSSIAQVGFDSFISFMPVYAHAAGLSASAIGTAMSAFAVASFGTRVILARTIARWGEDRVMAASFVSGAAAFFLLPLFQAPVALALIGFVFGIFVGFSQPLTMIMIFKSSPEGRGGEALGLRLSVNNLMRVIGPAVFGFTARSLGLAPLFIASGALLCLGGYMSRPARRAGPGPASGEP